MSRFLLILVMFVLAGCTSNSENLDKWLPVVPGHAHNDYLHDHPLVDALHYGFRSVEADIHLRDGGRLMRLGGGGRNGGWREANARFLACAIARDVRQGAPAARDGSSAPHRTVLARPHQWPSVGSPNK